MVFPRISLRLPVQNLRGRLPITKILWPLRRHFYRNTVARSWHTHINSKLPRPSPTCGNQSVSFWNMDPTAVPAASTAVQFQQSSFFHSPLSKSTINTACATHFSHKGRNICKLLFYTQCLWNPLQIEHTSNTRPPQVFDLILNAVKLCCIKF